MFRKLIFLANVFYGFSSFSQQNTIIGTVVNSEGAIPFAKVMLKKTNHYAITKLSGQFEITHIPDGVYNLEITAANHKPYRDTIHINSDFNLSTITLKSLGLELDAVVVTGTMKTVSISRSPVKIQLITSEFFKTNPVNNIIEALETVNGVQEQVNCGVCGTNDIHINGMEGPYTLVLIDGMPIVSGLSSAYGFNGIPTSLINRVEIIKGPSSTLYGTEAVGGVINIITKSPSDKTEFELDIKATSHEQYNGSIAFLPKISKKISSIFGVDYCYNQRMYDDNNDNFTDFTLNNRLSIFNKWQFKNKKNQDALNFAIRFYNEKRFGGTLQWDKAYLGSDSIYGEHIKTDRLELIGNYFLYQVNFQMTLNKLNCFFIC